jgi:hypothetical protein
VCSKRNPNTPACDNSQGKQTQTPGSNHGYNIARVNQINVEATEDGPNTVIGTFFINSVPATILFDSGASHSFIYAHYVHANSLPYLALRRPMIVITPKGTYEATYMSHRIEVNNFGKKVLGIAYSARRENNRLNPWHELVKIVECSNTLC